MKIKEIFDFLKSENIAFSFEGDLAAEVTGFSSLIHYKEGSFTWIKTEKNIPENFDVSKIQLAFVSEGIDIQAKNIIKTSESKHAFFSTIENFYDDKKERPDIGQFTYISPKVKLGKNVKIGHNCVLDGEIIIGDNTEIWNNVTIMNRVSIGNNCIIYSGTVIGHDGLAYSEDENYKRNLVKHYGGVTIGNNIRIGECTSIGRGTIDDTVLEDGVIIGSMGKIGHNCYLGKNASVLSWSMLFGSVHVEEHAYIVGSIVRNQCRIGKDAFVGFGSVVVKDVPAGQVVVGNPAHPFEKKGK